MTTGPIAIFNFDLSATGTVSKSIEIATAGRAAGLPIELWSIYHSGAMSDRVPEDCPVKAAACGKPKFSRAVELFRNIAGLSRLIRENQPHIVFSGGNHGHIALHLALLISGRRRSTRLLLRASNSSRRKQTPLHRLKSRLNNHIKYAGADLIVAVCHELAAEIAEVYDRKRIKVIPNGVDIEKVNHLKQAPVSHPWLGDSRANGPVIISMGRLAPQKGFDLLMKAFAELPLELDARLMIIGTGSPSQTASHLALAHRLGIENRTEFCGYVANPFALMARADLFVSSSRWEGASNALLEALACGVRVVATNCPTGNTEIINEIGHGKLAQSGDSNALKEAILDQLGYPNDPVGQSLSVQRLLDIKLCLDQWTNLLSNEYHKPLS